MLGKKKHPTKQTAHVVYRPHLFYDDTSRIIRPGLPQRHVFVRSRASAQRSADLLGILFVSIVTAIVINLTYMSPQTLSAPLQATTGEQRLQGEHLKHDLLGGISNTNINLSLLAPPTSYKMAISKKPTEKRVMSADPCTNKTVMNIVAHQDDDLLFINPQIAHDIQHHACVRTVYVTAGDDGQGTDYLHLRERGAEAAYNHMLNNSSPWIAQQLTLPSGAVATATSPQKNDTVSLLFLRLPDGNLDGSGFSATDFQSLTRLSNGEIERMTSVDNTSAYTKELLIDTLQDIMAKYKPIRINTQSNDDANTTISDHSDHMAVGAYTTAASRVYAARAHLNFTKLIHYYQGYPIRGEPPNLSAQDTQQKAAAFFAYAVDDAGVCTSIFQCEITNSSYGQYLSRQYTSPQ